MSDLPRLLRQAADLLEDQSKHEHGIPVSGETRTAAGQACVRLCDGNTGRARTMWKMLTEELGYMPHPAAVALIRAANTNIIPDIEAPEL